jgi:hypothetical protein
MQGFYIDIKKAEIKMYRVTLSYAWGKIIAWK